MKVVRIAILGVLASLLQASVADPISIAGAKPDLVFLSVVFIALYGPASSVLPLAWLLGSIEDVFSSGRFGVYGALYLVTAYFIVNSRDDLFTEHRLTQLLVVGLHALLVNLVLAAGTAIRYDLGALPRVFAVALIGVCFTTAFAPAVFRLAHVLTGCGPARRRKA